MLKICSSVLLLTEIEQTEKKIFSVCAAEDLEFLSSKLFESVTSVDSFGIIIAEVPFLRFLKDCREKVVVLHPGEYLKKLIAVGYEKFLFDLENRLEILSCLYVPDEKKATVIKMGKLVCDFENFSFQWKGSEIYLSKGEQKFLYNKLTKTKGDVLSSSDRAALCRMRKRLGKDFLADIRKERAVYAK